MDEARKIIVGNTADNDVMRDKNRAGRRGGPLPLRARSGSCLGRRESGRCFSTPRGIPGLDVIMAGRFDEKRDQQRK